MPDPHSKPGRIWTVAEAKARLSEVLRLSEEEGPQHYRQEAVLRGGVRRGLVCEDAAPPAARAVAGRQHAARRESRSSRRQEVGESDSLRRRRGGRRVGLKGFLLDTNVVSEPTRDAPDPRVVAFLSRQDELWLSAIVLHELEFGLGLLPPGRRRDGIDAALSAFVALYEDRILPLGRGARDACSTSETRSSPERRARTTSRSRPGMSAISRASASTWWIRGRRRGRGAGGGTRAARLVASKQPILSPRTCSGAQSVVLWSRSGCPRIGVRGRPGPRNKSGVTPGCGSRRTRPRPHKRPSRGTF